MRQTDEQKLIAAQLEIIDELKKKLEEADRINGEFRKFVKFANCLFDIDNGV